MRVRYWLTAIPVVLVFCFLISPVMASLDSNSMSENGITHSRRVIADGISPDEVKLYEAKGCVVKHEFKDAVSFDCPTEIIPSLKVREARVYHIMDLNADKQTGTDLVWDQGVDGSGVNVAILDTGIDMDHPELSDSYRGGYNCVNPDTAPEDDHGHGTHVAGIITADGDFLGNSKGVAPGAGIYMYKVCDAGGSCYDDDMRCGMEKAVLTDAKVMSISIGGGSYTTENCDSDYLANLINTIVSPQITAVIAAGNDGRGVSSPGCASDAIAVGAVDSSDNVAYFSGRGPALDILAPGVSIYSTTMDGSAGLMSGTSMATPHVAGVVALLYDANAGLNTAGIKDALYDTADPAALCYKCTRWIGTRCMGTTSVTCTDSITGAGVVDAFGAYSAITKQPCDCSDNNVCNGIETCDAAGGCLPGTPLTCDNGLYCDGSETCDPISGCQAGTAPVCSDNNVCTGVEVCDEATDRCTDPADLVCNDNNICTDDGCDAISGCTYSWPACGLSDSCCGPECTSTDDPDCTGVQCWSGSNNYLVKSDLQAMKFCSCAAGTYGFTGYSTVTAKKVNAYKYTDTGYNSIWTVARVSTRNPIDSVECSIGNSFPTNANYSR